MVEVGLFECCPHQSLSTEVSLCGTIWKHSFVGNWLFEESYIYYLSFKENL